MKQPSITLETITPQIAAEWLKGNTANRRLIKRHLDRLTAEMAAGLFLVTGDAIKFNGDRLLDGQHRLEAVIRSGATIQCFVARDVPGEVFPVLDTGRARGGGDVLSAQGFSNPFLLAAAGRLIYYFERKKTQFEEAVTNASIVHTMMRHRELGAFSSEVSSHRFAKNSAAVSTLYWITLTKNPRAEYFVNQFLTGAELKVTSPIYLLRERIIDDARLRANKAGRRAQVAMTFRVWKNWLEGRPQTMIKATQPSDAEFPWPDGAPYL